MPDVVPVPASVAPEGGTSLSSGKAGEALIQGDVCRLNASDQLVKADSSSAENAAAVVIVTSPALAAGDTVSFVGVGGSVRLGVTLAVGETYVVSNNSGKIKPIGDLVSGESVTHLGICTDVNFLKLYINASGVAKP